MTPRRKTLLRKCSSLLILRGLEILEKRSNQAAMVVILKFRRQPELSSPPSPFTLTRGRVIGPVPSTRLAVYCNCSKQEKKKAEETDAHAKITRFQLVDEELVERLVLRKISDKMQESPRSHIVYTVGPKNLQRHCKTQKVT